MEVWCQSCGTLLLKLDDGLQGDAYTLVVCSSCQGSPRMGLMVPGFLG